VTFENTSETEPLVTLRYFGPEVNPYCPKTRTKLISCGVAIVVIEPATES